MTRIAVKALAIVALIVPVAACQTDGQDQLASGPAAVPPTYAEYAADHDIVFARIARDGARFVTLSAEGSGGDAVEWLHFWNGEPPYALTARYRLSRWASGRRTGADVQDEFAFLADGSGYILGHKDYHDTDDGHEYDSATIRDWDGKVRHRIDFDRFDGMDIMAGCGIAVHPTEPKAALCLINRTSRPIHSKVMVVDTRSGKVLNHGTLQVPDSNPSDDLSYSPDGRFLTFRAAMLNSSVKWAGIADADGFAMAPIWSRRGQHRIAFDPAMKWRYEITGKDGALSLGVFDSAGTKIRAVSAVDGLLLVPGPGGQVLTLAGKAGGRMLVLDGLADGPSLVSVGEVTLGAEALDAVPLATKARWMVVTAKGVETRKLRTDAEIAGFRHHAEAWELAQAGIWDVMADKLRQGIAAMPTEIGSGIWDGRSLALAAKARRSNDYPMSLFGRLQVELLDTMMAAIPKSAIFGLSTAQGATTIKSINGEVARAAGLMVGDRILSVGGVQVVADTVDEVMAAAPTDRPVVLEIERAGRPVTVTATPHRELGDGRGNYFMKLSDYALMASEAGHPALVMAAVERMRQLVRDNPNGWVHEKLDPFITAHEVLALAGFGKLDEAYSLAARTGAMKAITIELNIRRSPDSFWPLLEDRAKMAYLLGIEEKDVPKRGGRPRAVPFPDLGGTVIQPAGVALPPAGEDPAALGWQAGPSGRAPASTPAAPPVRPDPVDKPAAGGVIILE